MLMSSDVNREGRSQLEHPAVKKDLKVERVVAGFERRSFPPVFHMRWKGESPWLGVLICACSFPSDVFPAQMEGVKLVVNKVLSSHFQVLPLVWSLLTPLPCLSLDSLLHTY